MTTKICAILLIYVFTYFFQNEFQVTYINTCNSNGLKTKEKIWKSRQGQITKDKAEGKINMLTTDNPAQAPNICDKILYIYHKICYVLLLG